MQTSAASPVPGLSGLTVLARGGYSTVYRALQESIGREVALKIDTRTLEDDRDRRRFLREAAAAGRMSNHPFIVELYDAGVTRESHPYLVMELCSRGSYAKRLKELKRIEPSEARDVGVKIADALAAAHSAGVLHRDVKPGNILLSQYGVPKLADFGLAALPDPSRELSVTIEALTPAYAAPEVFRMERPSPAGDVYALAATLYALLSGRPPRWPETGSPSLATMVRLHEDPLPDLIGVPIGLTEVLRRGMAPEIADRYASAAEFREALLATSLDPAAAPRSDHTTVAGVGSAYVHKTSDESSDGHLTGPSLYGTAASYSSAATDSARPQSPAPQPPVPQSPAPQSPAPQWPTQPSYSPPGPPVTQPPPGPTNGGSVPPQPGWQPGPQPSRQGQDGRPQRRAGLVAMTVVLVAALALILTGGLIWGIKALRDEPGTDPTASSSTSTQPTGGPTGSSSQSAKPSASGSDPFGGLLGDCPIGASLALTPETAGLEVKCVTEPECLRGITVVSGSATAAAVDCKTKHTWETFLTATLPEDVGPDYQEVNDSSVVRTLCSTDVLGLIAADIGGGWEVVALPPSQERYDDGERRFRCVAGKGTNALTGPTIVG